jgi:hypothetical protein
MRKRKKTDLELTAELCCQDEELGPRLQARYEVVRNGRAVWVKRENLSRQEMQVIIIELMRRGSGLIAQAGRGGETT